VKPHELATLRGLMIEADNCFEDLKRLGAISRPNAMDYRRHRDAARKIIAAHDAARLVREALPLALKASIPHPEDFDTSQANTFTLPNTIESARALARAFGPLLCASDDPTDPPALLAAQANYDVREPGECVCVPMPKRMKKHRCREGRTCVCSIVALEPEEDCPIHGSGPWPPRCKICGRFIRRRKTTQTG
jgi:hypothetical protein